MSQPEEDQDESSSTTLVITPSSPTASSSTTTTAATVTATTTTGGKGKKKNDKKSSSSSSSKPISQIILDQVMEKLAQNPLLNQHEEGQYGKQEIEQQLAKMKRNKDYIQGKIGLFGKPINQVGNHKFWSTQPVPSLSSLTSKETINEGPIEPNKSIEQIRSTPYDLPKDFIWTTVDLEDPNQLKETYDLLTQHYVEDADASFRFDYSSEFIAWALKPPGYVPEWHVGIRATETNKLVAFIAGIPMDLSIRSVTKRTTEINFLCVHKNLRSKRFAPLLIKEVTRRTHLRGIFQAVYTAGAFLPTPVTRCQYYHRTLSPQKLVANGFASVPRGSTMARLINDCRVPAETKLPGLREMEKRDVKAVARLLRAYLARMDMAPLLKNKEVEHALLGGRGKDVNGKRVGQVVSAYVVEDPVTHEITDMVSYYYLPSTVVKASTPTVINAAYLFYYATTSCPSCADLGDGSRVLPTTNWKDETLEQKKILQSRLILLINDALIVARKAGFDVFNALTLQDNTLFLTETKFGTGDGYLHYYLYNYATQPIAGGGDPTGPPGSGIGLVML